ncbi:PEP-CTERM protein-sorting domain-containing protein [Terrimicrobium sacchariphilum]|uniref:PEP-CTERM protein-sorting domain-containing protein n=1 Tax=Terrimicrobium sacchariphilum TaxID=690879 RepID=A0A146G670_TERSA|nr:PEP-CTERM sorting domain-containing protein [Terrimicrobium sacchariphilum]GAT32447.1 PEP-CTERM protein-sorting domain-containing protein [Terrimicrobium sacchariphilum]
MRRRLLLIACLIGLLSVSAARADILVTIDITNPAAVVFTATSAAPQSSGPNVPGTGGIDFLHFFAVEISGFASGLVSQSTFATYLDSSYPYQDWNTDEYSRSNVDLQFYSQKTSSQHFSTSDPAFVGTGTVDFSAYAAYLPTAGATGQITDGASGNASGDSRPLTVLGSYQVVPEPATWALLALGLAALLPGLRKLRKPAVARELR